MTTTIEWTDRTWNPTTGCDRVSVGCDNCYALTLAKRLKSMGQPKYQRDGNPKTSGPGFGISAHADVLAAPYTWKTPQKVFVNSMSDLFHDGVPEEFIARVWTVMANTPQHTYQILSKRHARMRSIVRRLAWRTATTEERQRGVRGSVAYVQPDEKLNDHLGAPHVLPNVWLGVSVENQQWADIRITALLDTPASVRWISAEPLLGPIDLFGPIVDGHRPKLTYWLDGRPGWGNERTTSTGLTMTEPVTGPRLDWVVAGGESGPGARPAHPDWFRRLRDQCQIAGVPFLFKQRGEYTWQAGSGWREPDLYVSDVTGQSLPEHEVLATGSWQGVWRVGKKRAGRDLDERTWDEYPTPATAGAR